MSEHHPVDCVAREAQRYCLHPLRQSSWRKVGHCQSALLLDLEYGRTTNVVRRRSLLVLREMCAEAPHECEGRYGEGATRRRHGCVHDVDRSVKGEMAKRRHDDGSRKILAKRRHDVDRGVKGDMAKRRHNVDRGVKADMGKRRHDDGSRKMLTHKERTKRQRWRCIKKGV